MESDVLLAVVNAASDEAETGEVFVDQAGLPGLFDIQEQMRTAVSVIAGVRTDGLSVKLRSVANTRALFLRDPAEKHVRIIPEPTK